MAEASSSEGESNAGGAAAPRADGPAVDGPPTAVSTVGTGSVIGLGCTAASVLFVLLGIVVFVILRLVT